MDSQLLVDVGVDFVINVIVISSSCRMKIPELL